MAGIATKQAGQRRCSSTFYQHLNFDNIIAEEIESSMAFGPGGGTRIGTHLKRNILKPFIDDVLDREDKLGRPYLILRSRMEAIKVKKRIDYENAIVDFSRKLAQNDYHPNGSLAEPSSPYRVSCHVLARQAELNKRSYSIHQPS